ncbi:MAG: hypothetical protein V1835_03140 [Candidatus Micrarchaeota archaeon]
MGESEQPAFPSWLSALRNGKTAAERKLAVQKVIHYSSESFPGEENTKERAIYPLVIAFGEEKDGSVRGEIAKWLKTLDKKKVDEVIIRILSQGPDEINRIGAAELFMGIRKAEAKAYLAKAAEKDRSEKVRLAIKKML